jgi:hypothetical protein
MPGPAHKRRHVHATPNREGVPVFLYGTCEATTSTGRRCGQPTLPDRNVCALHDPYQSSAGDSHCSAEARTRRVLPNPPAPLVAPRGGRVVDP